MKTSITAYITLALARVCPARVLEDRYIVLFKDDIPFHHQLNHIEDIRLMNDNLKMQYEGIGKHFKHLNMYTLHAHEGLVNHIRKHSAIQMVEQENLIALAGVAEPTESGFDNHAIQCKDVLFADAHSTTQLMLVSSLSGRSQMIHTQNAPASLGRISHKKLADWKLAKTEYVYDPTINGVPTAYLLDSGAQLNHTDFGGRVSHGPSCYKCSTADDVLGHGTHVLGTILGETVGIARTALGVSLKVIGDDRWATDSAIVGAIEYVLQQPEPDNLKVINMSLSKGYHIPILNQAINSAILYGVHIVVSAGNEALPLEYGSPQSATFALVVASIDDSDAKTQHSNWGEKIDLAAPGIDILSSCIGADGNKYCKQSGTSMAAPHVTGVICYMLTVYGPMTPRQVKAKLYEWSTERPVSGFDSSPRVRILYNGSGS